MPTNKWWAATVTAAGTEVVAVIQTGWHAATQIALVGLVVQRVVAYLVKNDEPEPVVPVAPVVVPPVRKPTTKKRSA